MIVFLDRLRHGARVTCLVDIISKVRKMKWSRAGHIDRLKEDRWISRITTWRPYDKKRRQGKPSKRWGDDVDIILYWRDTIWQRIAQDRLTWRRHAEVFAKPRDTRAADGMMMMGFSCMLCWITGVCNIDKSKHWYIFSLLISKVVYVWTIHLRPLCTRRFSLVGSRAVSQFFYSFLRDTRSVPRPTASGAISRRETARQTLTNQRFSFDWSHAADAQAYVGPWLRRHDKNVSGE